MSNLTDWLMVIITAVYVVATIFICKANLKSAEATKEQLEESKRQFEENKRQFEEQKRWFEETNRPFIGCEYILKNRAFCGIRFYNYGSKPASNVTFKINDSFRDAVEKEFANFWKLNNAEYAFGINQSYDFYFSSVKRFKDNKKDFEVTITYYWQEKQYQDTIHINFSKYLPVESVDEFEDKLLNEMKEITSAIKKNK